MRKVIKYLTWGHNRCILEEVIKTSVLHSLFFGCHEVSSFLHHLPSLMATGYKIIAVNFWKCDPKQTLHLLTWFIFSICYTVDNHTIIHQNSAQDSPHMVSLCAYTWKLELYVMFLLDISFFNVPKISQVI